MDANRLHSLFELLKNDPQDPFILYGIALEFKRSGSPEAAEYFNRLLEEHPEYLPTYYIAAEYFVASGDHIRATEIYEKGIKLASALQDLKTLSELKNAYLNFQLDQDDE